MDKFDSSPIIVKKIKKGGHGHHGGAWKVAMADFATAMMALFIVLWIINNSNEEQKEAIQGYFRDPAAYEDGKKIPSPYVIDMGGSPSVSDNIAESQTEDPTKVLTASAIEAAAEEIEKSRLEETMQDIQQQINDSATLSPYKDQIKIDITSEGLRVQIVDKSKRPMFDPGKVSLKYYAEDILYELAPMFTSLPNRLTITGHTDSSGSTQAWNVGNWELSAGRANTARRTLMDAGLPPEQVAQVVGMGDTAPYNLDDPFAPINRRIAVIVLNKRTDKAIASRAGTGDSEGDIVDDPDRETTINRSGSLLDKLQKEREREDNQYDNPPDADDEEAFW